MPNNLTDNPALFPTPIQVPAAGDPRTDTSVATPFQQVADRTANLQQQLAAVVPFTQVGYTPALPSGVTSGVSMLLTVTATSLAAAIATLQTIPLANRTAGMLCVLQGSGTCFGVYQYQATSPGAQTNTVVIPNDSTGAWVLLAPGYGLLGQPNVLPQADSTGRTPAAGVRNGLVGYQSINGQTNTTTTTSSYTILSGPSLLTFTGLLVGDIIEASFFVSIGCAATAGYYAQALIQALGPTAPLSNVLAIAATTPVPSAPTTATPAAELPASGVGTFVVPSGGAGTWTVGLYTSVSCGGNPATYTGGNLIAKVFRP